MNTFDKVIFVCNGNTCRSPMAATVMANLKQDIISELSYYAWLQQQPPSDYMVLGKAPPSLWIPI